MRPDEIMGGRSAGTPKNPLRDPTRGRAAGTRDEPSRDPRRARSDPKRSR